MLSVVKEKQKITHSKIKSRNKFLKDTKTDSEHSEHKLENRFDKNKDNEIDSLDELFKGMGLEPYQFEPTKNMKNHRKGAVRLRRKISF